jgi:hypothetical protein
MKCQRSDRRPRLSRTDGRQSGAGHCQGHPNLNREPFPALVLECNFGLWRSLASALAWGARGPEFKSRQPDQIPQRHTNGSSSGGVVLESNWSPNWMLRAPHLASAAGVKWRVFRHAGSALLLPDVPEPASLWTLAFGVFGLALLRRGRRSKSLSIPPIERSEP